MIIGSFSAPAISSTRPIMVAGPMERNSRPRKSGSDEALGGGPWGAPPPRPCAQINPAMPKLTVATVNAGRKRKERRKRIGTVLSKPRKIIVNVTYKAKENAVRFHLAG